MTFPGFNNTWQDSKERVALGCFFIAPLFEHERAASGEFLHQMLPFMTELTAGD